jgi:hypothetical protein
MVLWMVESKIREDNQLTSIIYEENRCSDMDAEQN